MQLTSSSQKAMVRKSLRTPNPVLRKELSSFGGFGSKYWDSLKWKPVDVSNDDLGDFGDRYGGLSVPSMIVSSS